MREEQQLPDRAEAETSPAVLVALRLVVRPSPAPVRAILQ